MALPKRVPEDPPPPDAVASAAATTPAELLEAVRRQLVRSVARICPRWLENDREDIVQEALIRVGRKLQSDPEAGCGASYVWRAAYSATIDEIRRRGRRPQVVEFDETRERPAPAGWRPDERAQARQVREAVRDCVQRLPADRRRGVTLHLLGHSVPDLGRLLGWSTKQAENFVYRGLADVRRCVESKGVTP